MEGLGGGNHRDACLLPATTQQSLPAGASPSHTHTHSQSPAGKQTHAARRGVKAGFAQTAAPRQGDGGGGRRQLEPGLLVPASRPPRSPYRGVSGRRRGSHGAQTGGGGGSPGRAGRMGPALGLHSSAGLCPRLPASSGGRLEPALLAAAADGGGSGVRGHQRRRQQLGNTAPGSLLHLTTSDKHNPGLAPSPA